MEPEAGTSSVPVSGLVPSRVALTGTNEDDRSDYHKFRRVKPFQRKVASCNDLGKLPSAGFEPAAYGFQVRVLEFCKKGGSASCFSRSFGYIPMKLDSKKLRRTDSHKM